MKNEHVMTALAWLALIGFACGLTYLCDWAVNAIPAEARGGFLVLLGCGFVGMLVLCAITDDPNDIFPGEDGC